MIKFILFILMVFSLLNSIHEAYGLKVFIKNATATILQNNVTTTDTSIIYSKEITIDWCIFILSIFIIFIVTIISSWIIKRAQKNHLQHLKDKSIINNIENTHQGGFWDIIREGDYFPSLARFHFLLWIFVISFTLLSTYFILLRDGITTPELGLPVNTLLLMGISTVVPIISNVVSRGKIY